MSESNNPQHGGSYVRDKDGALTRVEGPALDDAPAQPKQDRPARKPKAEK